MQFKSNTKQLLFSVGIFCVIVFCYITVRSWLAYSRANTMLVQEQYQEAIEAYGEAIRWYAPLNPWNHLAVKKAQTLAEDLEKKGLLKPAKNIHIELRSSLSSVRGAYFPMYKVAKKSSQQYVSILIDELKMLPSISIDLKVLKQKYLLNKKRYIHTVQSLIFILWLISFVFWIIKSFDKNGKLQASKIGYAWGLSNVLLMGWWLCLLTYL